MQKEQLKIAIIGYGNMGRLITSIAPSLGIQVVSIIDPFVKDIEGVESSISAKTLKDADVCIDFSIPDVVVSNIEKISNLGKNIVIGTTNWKNKINYIEKITKEKKIGIIYGSNFSVGMNAFFSIIRDASKLINHLDEYDLFGYEMHHNRKIDSPSGTAKSLSRIIIDEIDRKNNEIFDRLNRKIEKNEFHFASIRSGNIPGTHVIGFDSFADTIELKHTARNREGFARGALKAAHWISHKEGLFDFQDIFKEMIFSRKEDN